MTKVEVVASGLQTTVQDLGRPGFGHLGISACGAADPLALRLGNLLLGNPEGAAGLEMTLIGGEFRFLGAACCVLAGSDFGATLDGTAMALWTPTHIGAGQTLALGGARSGARCYACFAGAVSVPAVLGSCSTHIPSAIGGWRGRALVRGDLLAIGESPGPYPCRRVNLDALERLRRESSTLRATSAAQTSTFSTDALAHLYSLPWTVQHDSNRMGVRLSGDPLSMPEGGNMMTEGTPLGAIQVTPSGEPVILFVDHQTTGGYPKIACVISADHWRVGQLRPHQSLRFEHVSFDEARRLLMRQEEILQTQVMLG